jgi:hypothetical protein
VPPSGAAWGSALHSGLVLQLVLAAALWLMACALAAFLLRDRVSGGQAPGPARDLR